MAQNSNYPPLPRFDPSKTYLALPPAALEAIKARLRSQKLIAGKGLRLRKTLNGTAVDNE